MIMVVNSRSARSILHNRRGLATVESIPLLVIFIMLAAYAMGLWGSVHTAILHSIAARTYAFETFRNRTNLTVFRENTNLDKSNLLSYVNFGVRLHAVGAESRPDDGKFYVSRRPLSVGFPPAPSTATREDHLTRIFEIQPRNQSVDVGPIWLMIGYGICLDAECGR